MKREPTNFEALTCEIFSNIQDAMHKITPVSATPKVNVDDENGVYNVDLFYPGKSREDFKIEVKRENEKDIIIFSSDFEIKKEFDKYLIREFIHTRFIRKFLLPADADRKKIIAKYEGGVLKVKIPKDTKKQKENNFSINID